jgi:hypothetical protein
MSSLSNYNTFNISPGKQAYLCSINDFWASRLKSLARTNYLPLNERLFKINLRESSKCNYMRWRYSRRSVSFLIWMQNRTWYQTIIIRRNRNSNKIVLSGSRVFRVTALSKAAVLDQRLLS